MFYHRTQNLIHSKFIDASNIPDNEWKEAEKLENNNKLKRSNNYSFFLNNQKISHSFFKFDHKIYARIPGIIHNNTESEDYTALWVDRNKNCYSVKKIISPSSTTPEKAITEISLYNQFYPDNPAFICTHQTDKKTTHYLVFPYRGLDLYALFTDPNIHVSHKIDMLIQCLEWVFKIHEQQIIHRNIKPANFSALFNEETQRYEVALNNFGYAKKLDNEKTSFIDKFVGTATYAPPLYNKTHKKHPYKGFEYSKSTDLHAAALLVDDIFQVLKQQTERTFSTQQKKAFKNLSPNQQEENAFKRFYPNGANIYHLLSSFKRQTELAPPIKDDLGNILHHEENEEGGDNVVRDYSQYITYKTILSLDDDCEEETEKRIASITLPTHDSEALKSHLQEIKHVVEAGSSMFANLSSSNLVKTEGNDEKKKERNLQNILEAVNHMVDSYIDYHKPSCCGSFFNRKHGNTGRNRAITLRNSINNSINHHINNEKNYDDIMQEIQEAFAFCFSDYRASSGNEKHSLIRFAVTTFKQQEYKRAKLTLMIPFEDMDNTPMQKNYYFQGSKAIKKESEHIKRYFSQLTSNFSQKIAIDHSRFLKTDTVI